MFVDGQLLFSQNQAVTAAAGSTSTIDLSVARDIGVGKPLYIVVACTETMDDSGDDSTLAVALEGDSTDTITPDYTRTLFTFAANSAAGTVKYAPITPEDLALRYARLLYTPANGNLSAGKFTAFITADIQKYKAYPDNVTITG